MGFCQNQLGFGHFHCTRYVPKPGLLWPLGVVLESGGSRHPSRRLNVKVLLKPREDFAYLLGLTQVGDGVRNGGVLELQQGR